MYCLQEKLNASELDLSNYATTFDLKHATGVDTSKFAERVNLDLQQISQMQIK